MKYLLLFSFIVLHKPAISIAGPIHCKLLKNITTGIPSSEEIISAYFNEQLYYTRQESVDSTTQIQKICRLNFTNNKVDTLSFKYVDSINYVQGATSIAVTSDYLLI